ncbi:MAG: hypothetical protein KDD67_07835 [Ignavibacteriae bacterium]|nr:hypothetical protein [Ignavibacteriota bacterium]MCB9215907.1 hypothetical protein [Ignavibacteria bacterium]
MSSFGERVQLFWGSIDGSDGTGGSARETDGFLTVTLSGKDESWTYATAKITSSERGGSEVLGQLTWAYSAQQNFMKHISLTVPVKRGESFHVDWSDKREAKWITARLLWTPLLP